MSVWFGATVAGVADVLVEKCRVVGPINLVRLKLRPDTPRRYEDLHYRDITLDGTGRIFRVRPWTQYFDLKGQPPPKSFVRNVTPSNIKGSYGAFGTLQGNPGQTEISDIKLADIDVRLNDEKPNAVDVKNLRVAKVTVNGKPFSLRPAG